MFVVLVAHDQLRSLLRIAFLVFGAQMMAASTDLPTVQSTDSSAGLSSVPQSSGSRLEELASDQFPGRPDLWLAATVSERATA